MPAKKSRPVYTKIGRIKPLGKSRLVKKAKPRPWRPYRISSYQLSERLPLAREMVIHRRPSGRPDVAMDPRELRAVSKTKVRGTLPERIVYKSLTQRRLSPVRDFDFQSSLLGGRLQLGGIVADFLFQNWRLIVRIQGPTHKTQAQILKDLQQMQLLVGMGWTVYDLPEEIVYDMMALENWMRRHIDLHPSLGGQQVVGQTIFLATGEMNFAWTAQEHARVAALEDAVDRLEDDITKIQATAIFTPNGLSDIDTNLGLIQTGEFRVGNRKPPGGGFTGMRMAYPGMTYSSEAWHLVGVANDVLQFGVRATDGKLIAGAGAVILDASGITAIAGIIGGWTLGATSLVAGSGANTVGLDSGGVNPAFYAGHATPASAPFRVSPAGALVATSATIAGTITATAGTIGGWTIDADEIKNISAGLGITLDSSGPIIRVGDTDSVHIVLEASGGDKHIRSSNFSAGAAGFNIDADSGDAEFNRITARGRIKTAVFEVGEVSAIGGDLVVLDADELAGSMSALDLSTVVIAGNTTFSMGDLLRIKEGTDDEWLEVTSVGSAPAYGVARDKAGSYAADNNPAWNKGVAVVNYGSSGAGGIRLISGANPYVAVFTHAGTPWATITDHVKLEENISRFGSDIGSAADTALAIFHKGQTYNSEGVGAGDLLIGDNTASKANIFWDKSTGRLEFRGGTTMQGYVDTDGTATFGGGSVILGTSGIVIKGISELLQFQTAGSGAVATMFIDIAENLQLRLDGAGAFTFSEGDVIIEGTAIDDPVLAFHETGVAKSRIWYDASDNNLIIENVETGVASIVYVISNDTGTWDFYVSGEAGPEHRLVADPGAEVVFNEQGRALGFRIEGATNPNLFKMVPGTDVITYKGVELGAGGADIIEVQVFS